MFDQALFIRRLKELREERGMSQTDLAEDLEVTRGAVGHWETGNREPSMEYLNRMADLFGVSVDFLMGKTDLKNEFEAARYLIDRLKDFGFVKNGRVDVSTIDEFMRYAAVIKQIKEG